MLSQSRITAGITKAASRHGILRAALPASLLLGALQFASAAAYAQEEPVNFDLLIFDAVPLALQPVAPPSDPAPAQAASYQATELAALPRSNPRSVAALVRLYANPVAPALADTPIDTSIVDVERYEAALKELEQKGDAYALQLTESLMDLATSYENSGDYVKALPLYERANHVTRVNHGLFSLEQVPIVERLIANQVARGDLLSAHQQEEYLYYLHRRIHGDINPALLPAMLRYAEWNVYAFRARMLTPPPPSLDELTDPTPSTTREPVPVEDIIDFRIQRLMTAQAMYKNVIGLMLANFGPGDARLPGAERALAVTNYLYATQVLGSGTPMSELQNSFYTGGGPIGMLGFSEGHDALRRRVHYLEQAGTTPAADIVRAKLEVGDWLISSRKRMNALELYDEVHAEYAAGGHTQEEIDALFHPALPVSIPTFVISPYSRRSLSIPADAAVQYKGYVDVEYVVGRYGQTSLLRELARSTDTPDRVVDALLRTLRRDQYRPRFSEGKLMTEDRIQARYYYAY